MEPREKNSCLKNKNRDKEQNWNILATSQSFWGYIREICHGFNLYTAIILYFILVL